MANPQSKNRTLIFIIVLLLITNILVLSYFLFWNKKPNRPKGKDGFESALQKEVGFTDEQLQKFKAIKETHWAAAKKNMDQIKQIKYNIFSLTKIDTVSESTVAALADSLARVQKQMEINSFYHFKETRQLCTPQQQPAYDSLMKKVITRMGRGGKNGEKDKK